MTTDIDEAVRLARDVVANDPNIDGNVVTDRSAAATRWCMEHNPGRYSMPLAKAVLELHASLEKDQHWHEGHQYQRAEYDQAFAKLTAERDQLREALKEALDMVARYDEHRFETEDIARLRKLVGDGE